MSPFQRTCFWNSGFLSVSKAGSRPGEPQGTAAQDGADAISVHRDQGPEVSGQEGGRKSSSPLHFHCSTQTKSCVFCSHRSLFNQSFWLLINDNSDLWAAPDNSGMFI